MQKLVLGGLILVILVIIFAALMRQNNVPGNPTPATSQTQQITPVIERQGQSAAQEVVNEHTQNK